VLGWFLLRELDWHSEAEQRLAMLASTDGLTGLSNRWHFDDTIRKEWRRARRDRTPVALLMIDADAFKDDDGKLYLYFKNDGNRVGKHTAIWAQQLAPDGLSVTGAPAELIHDDKGWEQRLVEAPTIYSPSF